ncbi:MAG: thiol-disulfide oxidoreductase DCC family protein [Bacteroidetes bacterium]|nr:thiol-disulfide oxidoreductase DCC family protein [Bacteroidota bacterium]
MNLPDKPVLLFDGVCNFCNSTVNFIMKRDRSRSILFASLQSAEGAALMRHFGQDPGNLYSIVLIHKGRYYDCSTAALCTARIMGGIWRPMGWAGLVFPRFIRDAVYRWIARNRYSWFGKKEACRIPTPEERARFYSLTA